MLKIRNNSVIVGKITRTHGIKGELRLLPFFMEPDFIFAAKEMVFYNDTGAVAALTVESMRRHAKFILLKLKDLNSINEVQHLAGTEVSIDKALLPPLEQEEFYAEDVIGLKAQDLSGQEVGTVTGLLQTPANDVYEIKGVQGQEYLVPGTRDYVHGIDLEKRIITITIPQYI